MQGDHGRFTEQRGETGWSNGTGKVFPLFPWCRTGIKGYDQGCDRPEWLVSSKLMVHDVHDLF